MAKRLIRYISIRDTESGKVLSKGHYSLMAAGDKARKIAKKTGRATQVNDEYGVYLKFPGSSTNPRTLPRGRWFNTKIRVTKSGEIQAQMPRSEVRSGTGVKSLYSKSGKRRIVRTNPRHRRVKNPPFAKYRGVVTAKPGKLLLGAKTRVTSSWFSTKREAKDWLYGMKQANAALYQIEGKRS